MIKSINALTAISIQLIGFFLCFFFLLTLPFSFPTLCVYFCLSPFYVLIIYPYG